MLGKGMTKVMRRPGGLLAEAVGLDEEVLDVGPYSLLQGREGTVGTYSMDGSRPSAR